MFTDIVILIVMSIIYFLFAAGPFNAALKENGHNHILKYTPNHTRQENSSANPITEEQNEAEPNHTVCKKEEETQKQEK